MKLKVLINSFGGIFILAVILVIRLSYGPTPLEAFAMSLFPVSIAVLVLLVKSKYMKNLTNCEGKIVIDYLTRFLKEKTTKYYLSDIEEVRISKRLPIAVVWPPVLKFKVNNQWITFYVVSKKLYDEIQQHLSSANIVFVK